MTLIKGIYAASMSILNNDLTLNTKKTIQHAEMIIDNGCHGAPWQPLSIIISACWMVFFVLSVKSLFKIDIEAA